MNPLPCLGAEPVGGCASVVDLGGTKEDLGGLGVCFGIEDEDGALGACSGIEDEDGALEVEPSPSTLGHAPAGMILFDCK